MRIAGIRRFPELIRTDYTFQLYARIVLRPDRRERSGLGGYGLALSEGDVFRELAQVDP